MTHTLALFGGYHLCLVILVARRLDLLGKVLGTCPKRGCTKEVDTVTTGSCRVQVHFELQTLNFHS